MSFQIWMKTNKSLQQLATEIRDILALPQFKQQSFAGESYCQFQMFGMHLFIRRSDEEMEQDPEVKGYAYSLDMEMSFIDHELDTDFIEQALQPYYAQLLTFHLGIETACREQKKVGNGWQIRYNFYCKNPKWTGSVLYGEDGWEPAVNVASPGPWRSMLPRF